MGTFAPTFTVTALGSILMVLAGGLKGLGGVGAPGGLPRDAPKASLGGVIGGRWELGCSGGGRPPFPARG